MGIAIAPRAFAAPDIEAGRLVAPFGFAPVDARYVLLHPLRVRNVAVGQFGDWLREEGAAMAPPPRAVQLI